MKGRKRTAQVLAILGSVILFAGAALHSVLGSRVVFAALDASNGPPDIVHGLKAVWLIVAWHWTVIGIVAIAAAFSQLRIRRAVVLLCGIVLLADGAGMYAALGIFIGNAMIFAAAIAFLAGAALFPSEPHPPRQLA
jgi:hypothetical protein